MPRHVVAEESGRRGGESRDGRLRGRGARSNRSGRYEALVVEEADDGWGHADEPAKLRTEVQLEQALLNLAAGGAGVIVISQDLEEILEIADNFAALNEGRLSAPRPAAGLSLDEIGLMMGGAHDMETAHHAVP